MSDGLAIGEDFTRGREPGAVPGSRLLRAVPLAIAVVIAAIAGPASAHGGAAALEATPSRVTAGGSLTVFGDDLSPSVSGLVHLLTARGDILVGRAEMDADGHLQLPIQVPADLPPRIYELRLTDDLGIVVSTFVTVEESAADDGGLLRLVVAAIGAAVALGVLIWALRMPGGTRRR
jgi:hypothetical protein